ncbi:hypothetical protein ENBRE01_1481 [Enteropsectra breve]|nr:hypothetical protein ENBRE01_1481 [Enteropsectra breve]
MLLKPLCKTKDLKIRPLYLCSLLQRQAPTRESDKSNSTVPAKAPGITTPVYTFKIPIPGSDLSLERRIVGLESIETPDCVDWISQFQELARQAKWNNETALAVFQRVVSLDILEIIGSRTTLDTAIGAILSRKFPPRDQFLYDQELLALQQKDYTFTEQ